MDEQALELMQKDWTQDERDLFRLRKRWLKTARPKQLPPPGRWWIWLFLAGRGSGKTRSAAEDMAYYGLARARSRLSVVGKTFADVRNTCFEGESGIVNGVFEQVFDRSTLDGRQAYDRHIYKWNRSTGELILRNGTIMQAYPGDEPDRLRGPQFHRTWVDELAAMERQDELWANVEMSTRLPPDPRIIVTTTPRPTRLIRELVLRSLPKELRGLANLDEAEQARAQDEMAKPGSFNVTSRLAELVVRM